MKPRCCLKPVDIEGFAVALQKPHSKLQKPFASATINHHLKLSCAAINNAAANDYDVGKERNHVRLLRLYKKHDRICSEDEFRRIIRGQPGPQVEEVCACEFSQWRQRRC